MKKMLLTWLILIPMVGNNCFGAEFNITVKNLVGEPKTISVKSTDTIVDIGKNVSILGQLILS